MTTEMTDPTHSLKAFQQALAHGDIAPRKAELHNDLLVLIDQINGIGRFTYALIKDRNVVAVAIFVVGDPMNDFPCLNTGYAVDQAHRSKGYGKEVTQKAFDELTNGFQRAKIPHVYVEAFVSTTNEHSKKLAARLFSDTPIECTDSVSGQPALQFVRQLF